MQQKRQLFLTCCIIIIFLISAYKGLINFDFVPPQSGESSNHQNEEFYRNQSKESSTEQSEQSSSNPNQASSKNHSEKSSSNQNQETSTQKGDGCKTLHFSEDPLPVTALFSYPGSGNTWLRHLIQQTTGIYTGSVYNDGGLRKAGFLGERITNGSVIMVKTHYPYKVTDTHFIRAIVLIRNPADALRAQYNYLNTHSQIGHAPVDYFKTKEWDKFASHQAYAWKRNYLRWSRFPGPLLFVQYEDLVQNLQSELRRILDFLGQDVPEKDMQCVVNNKEGKHHRSAVNFNFDLYRPDFRNNLNELHTLIVNTYQDRKET